MPYYSPRGHTALMQVNQTPLIETGLTDLTEIKAFASLFPINGALRAEIGGLR